MTGRDACDGTVTEEMLSEGAESGVQVTLLDCRPVDDRLSLSKIAPNRRINRWAVGIGKGLGTASNRMMACLT